MEKFINFSDGVKIKISGPFRVLRRSDGYYVVGGGSCVPVSSFNEAESLVKDLKTNRKEWEWEDS